MSAHIPTVRRLWRVGSVDGGHNVSHIYEGRNAIAQVYGLPMHTTVEEVEGDPAWAKGLENAKLLAASPVMREALEYIAIHSSQSDLRQLARDALDAAK